MKYSLRRNHGNPSSIWKQSRASDNTGAPTSFTLCLYSLRLLHLDTDPLTFLEFFLSRSHCCPVVVAKLIPCRMPSSVWKAVTCIVVANSFSINQSENGPFNNQDHLIPPAARRGGTCAYHSFTENSFFLKGSKKENRNQSIKTRLSVEKLICIARGTM